MKKVIHINKHHIMHNNKHPDDIKPPITCKISRDNIYGYSVEVLGPSKVVYKPEKPLSCGAKVWIETSGEVKIDTGTEVISLL